MNEKLSQDLIDNWKGGYAIFFEYRCSLGYFRIAVTSKSKSGCLDIQCLETTYIQGRTRWADFNVEIDETDFKTEEGYPVRYIISDKNAELEIHCGMISVEELEDFNDLIPDFSNHDEKKM